MTVLTTSINDIVNISQQLAAFQELNNGQIAGIPFVLRRRPKKISRPAEDGKRVRVEKWLLSIEADPEWVRAKLTQVKRLALPGNGLSHDEDVVESTVVETDEEWDDEADATVELAEQAEEQTQPEADDLPVGLEEPDLEPEVVVKEPEIPENVKEAMELSGSDGKKYGDCAVFELNRKKKAIGDQLAKETDQKKVSIGMKHIDSLTLLIEYRKAEFENQEALPTMA
jgi:hypothetical protein